MIRWTLFDEDTWVAEWNGLTLYALDNGNWHIWRTKGTDTVRIASAYDNRDYATNLDAAKSMCEAWAKKLSR